MKKQNDTIGYVYILTNPSFKDDWVKIGRSSRPVDIRSKELDNTAVPLPFDIYATIKSTKYKDIEKLVHKMLDRLTNFRIRRNREFFNVNPQVVLDIFYDIASTIDDAVVECANEKNIDCSDDKTNLSKNLEDGVVKHKKPRPPFKFSMVNIPIGEKITFIYGDINVKVANDNQVEYQGKLYKLSTFAKTFMPNEKRIASSAYQGPKYFKYKGEILDDMRTRLEAEKE